MAARERFDPYVFFADRASGRGAVRDRRGRVTDAFTVEAQGKALTSRDALVLNETYTFRSGRTDSLHWDLPRTPAGGGRALEDKVSGGVVSRWDGGDLVSRFTRPVAAGARGGVKVDFTVRFSLLDPEHALSAADIRRWGRLVGSMVTLYTRGG